MLPSLNVNHINADTPAWQVGLVAKEGGIITVDTPLSFYFKGLHIGNAGATGTVLIRGPNNNIIPVIGVLSGAWIWAIGYEVVSAATVDGVALTTTATNITWVGGV